MPHFLDTNILLYSLSPNAGEAVKRARAEALLDDDDGAVSVQVLQEFYVQATRPTRAGRLPHDLAIAMIDSWIRFKVQDMTLAIMLEAIKIMQANRLSYWDGAIVAAARALDCRVLYSEDMNHGQVVAGVRIINPFR